MNKPKRRRRPRPERFMRKMWNKYREPLYCAYIDAVCWYGACWPRSVCINLVFGIRNLVRWFPLIWHDRDWDAWRYLLPLMEKKIEQMERCEASFSQHEGRERLTRQMQTCRILIKRLRDDDYLNKSWYIADEIRGRGTHIIYRQLKDALAAHNHEKHQRKQDLDLLFKILRRHIEDGWWN